MLVGVIGNEACDADSIVSAIALCDLRKSLCHNNEYIPFVQCSPDDWDTRLDFQCIQRMCFPAGRFPVEFLKSSESMPNPVLEKIEAWVLVDHHNARSIRAVSHAPIIGIIDHHTVSESDPVDSENLDSCDIREIGSCCSIIGEMWLSQVKPHTESLPVLKMLLCTIILDTGNLHPVFGKTTATDTTVVRELMDILKIESTDMMFAELLAAKFDPAFWMKAPLPKILKYDYKEYGSVGMASILAPVSGLNMHAIDMIRKQSGLKYLVVIAGYPRDYGNLDGDFVKELLICDELDRDYSELAQRFHLTEMLDYDCLVRVYSVSDPAFSRKKFAPVFLDYVNR